MIEMRQAGLLQEIYCVSSTNSKRQMNRRLYKNAISAVARIGFQYHGMMMVGREKETTGEEVVVAYFNVLFVYLVG